MLNPTKKLKLTNREADNRDFMSASPIKPRLNEEELKMVTLDFSKAKTIQDVKKVFDDNKEEIILIVKTFEKLKEKSQ